MLHRFTGLAWVAALVCALYWTVRLERADWLFVKGDAASMREAMRLAPGNAEYASALAEAEPARAVEILRDAAARNPLDGGLRVELGLAEEERGDLVQAEADLIEAERLDQGFAPRWAMSDFYFHRQEAEKFWPVVKDALRVSYGEVTAQFRQCWSLTGDGDFILERAIPDRPVVLRRYLDFLVTEGRLNAAVPVAQKSKLGAKLAAGKFVAFVEILPPRGVDAKLEIDGARRCAEAGIDCINVPDGPRASARMSAQVTCQLIQQQAGIEAVNHFCCRDRNILGIQSELLGAHSAGVRNLICITGDPPRMGLYPDATAVFDVDAIGLVNIVNNLNHGLDIGGNPMGSQTAMLIGVGANPGALNMDEEIRRLNWKLEAGAEYIVTQPVFDLDLLEAFLKRIAHLKIPVICGIWPLTSYRNAEFMVNELRVPVPEHFMARMQRVDNAEKAREEGVRIAREMVVRVRGMVQGVQLSAPFGRYQMALDVAEAIGPR